MIPQIILGKRYDHRQMEILNDLSKAGIREVYFQPAVYDGPDAISNISTAHKNCVRKAVDSDWPLCVVMEDDVLFTGSNSYARWYSMIEGLPADWDIFLAGAYGGHVVSGLNNGAVKLSRFSGMHLYAVNRKFFQKFLHADPSKNIDSWIGLKSGANIYCSMPMMAIQKPGYSEKDGRVVDHSDTLNIFLQSAMDRIAQYEHAAMRRADQSSTIKTQNNLIP